MSDWLDLHSLADGELNQKEANLVRAWISADNKAQAEYESIVVLKQTIREKASEVEVEDLWLVCSNRINEIDRVGRVNGFVWKYGWGICGVFLAVIVVGGTLHRNTEDTGLIPSKVSSIKSSMVPIPGLRTLKQAVNAVRSKFGEVVSAGSEKVQLLNASEGYMNGLPAMKLDCADGLGKMSLYVMPASGIKGVRPMADSRFRQGTMPEGNFVCWNKGTTLLILSGDRTPEELRQVALQL